MKWLSNLAGRFVFAFIIAALASLSASATQNKGIIRSIRNGSAEISVDRGKQWKRAQVGAIVAADSMLRTHEGTTLDVFVGDNGPVIRLAEKTTLGIDRLDVENTGIEKVIDTRLDLKEGRIFGNVKKMAAASRYEIKFPNGVVAVRGTEYAISAEGRLQIVSGAAFVIYEKVRNSEGYATIQAGQQVALTSDGSLQFSAIAPDDPVLQETIIYRVGPIAYPSAPVDVMPGVCACGPVPRLEPPDLRWLRPRVPQFF